MNNKLFSLVIAVLLAVGALPASAQESISSGNNFSLQQCIDYAMQNTGAMKNARLEIRIAEAKVKEVAASGLPQVNLEANVVHNPAIAVSPLPDFITPIIAGSVNRESQNKETISDETFNAIINGTYNETSLVGFGQAYSNDAGITLNQLLFDGTFFMGLKAAKVYTQLSEKQLTQTSIETVANISKAYYTTLISAERLKVLNDNYKSIEKLYNETKITFEAGLVEQIELDRITVTYNNIAVQKQRAEQMLEITRKLLKFQMGMDIYQPIVLTDDIRDIYNQMPKDDKPTMSSPESRIEYSMLNTQMDLNNLEKKATAAGFFPKLYGFASVGANSFGEQFGESFNDWNGNARLGLSLKMNLFDGFMKVKQIQQINLQRMQLENQQQDLFKQISIEQEQAKVIYVTNMKTLETQQDNMEVAKRVYDISQIKFKEGVGSSLEVTNAETAYMQASDNFFAAVFDALTAKIDLDKANGTLYQGE